MAEITDFPIVQPTPEEVAAYEQQFGPPPLNPIRDLTAPELADLASADKENFELVSAFRANKDLWADQSIVSKVADAHNLIRQRGFSLSDLPSPRRAAGLALDVAKGFGKQLWNYGAAGVETAMGIGADLTGQEGIARELEQQAQRRVAENIAGSEQALFGLADMAGRAIQKTGRAVGIAKPLTAQTPEEKIADLWTAVGTGETQEDIGRGAGGFLTPVGGSVISELAAAGKPVRPEETAALAAGDPFSFYTFGKGFQIAGGAVPTVARQAAAQVGQRAGQVAEQAAGVGVRTLGKLTELGGRAAEITGKAAPVIAATGAAISGQPIAALAILGGGTTAGRAVQVAGRGAATAGRGISEVGRQVSGRPIVSPLAQGIRDVAGALPGAAGEIITGTAADLGLAAVSAETPQQTESAVGIGTVLGAVGAAKRIAGRVISGQLIAPREYGIDTPTASSGAFPLFDRMHSAAFASAPPGVRARLNAVREFARGAKVDTDVFLAPDSATLEKALIDVGFKPEVAKTASEQEGFFTASVPGQNRQSRRVIFARNVEAAPHEAFHAFQDVLGEAANQEIDALVRQEYGDQWESIGDRYARRLVDDMRGRAWEEVVLDDTGQGLDAAKEKLYRDVYNKLEAETGSAPPDSHVRDLVEVELVRIFNEAQARNPEASSDQFWREVLSPEEAKAEADRYIARELAAENFDAVFKQRGAGLQTRPGLLQKLSRIVGNTLSTLGAEPLAGRRTEIGQIEPRFRVTERVAELAQGDVQPTTPARPTPGPAVAPPRGTLPSSPEGRQQVAEEARSIAEQAPDAPQPGGTRSPRELLGQIAEAIAQQAGVRINYLSAPDVPAAATTSNRTVRREIIEAFRTMPQAARSLWEKSFFPERVLKTKSGFQVMGWAPEVFAANAHKLARTLSELPNGQSLIPYQLDVANKTFTDAGWQQLFADTQNFVRNQMAGQTGAGEPLVVPRELTDRGFFAPQSTPARAVDLAQPQADTINMLFNFRLPDTPRVTAGRLPLNIAGQEISIATAGGPQRLSVPVEPRAPFTGESAGALGIEGRSILEVNPVRSAIEQAASQAKVALPSFIEAIQKLNLENIKEVELAPELPQFRGNTLTLTAGFQPSTDPRAIKTAATRDERTGQIYEGSWHGESYDFATSAGARDVDLVEGFTTNTGEFLTRDAAFNRARELNQVPEEIQQESFGRERILESQEFDALRQFQPVAESARRLTEMTPEEWLSTVRNYKGKLGAGLTGWAWDLGSQAKTIADVQALRSVTEALREASKSGDLNQRLELIGRAQAAREAYEAATGRNLEDTNDGSAVPGIRKMVDPNYQPPVPPKDFSGQFQPSKQERIRKGAEAVRRKERAKDLEFAGIEKAIVKEIERNPTLLQEVSQTLINPEDLEVDLTFVAKRVRQAVDDPTNDWDLGFSDYLEENFPALFNRIAEKGQELRDGGQQSFQAQPRGFEERQNRAEEFAKSVGRPSSDAGPIELERNFGYVVDVSGRPEIVFDHRPRYKEAVEQLNQGFTPEKWSEFSADKKKTIKHILKLANISEPTIQSIDRRGFAPQGGFKPLREDVTGTKQDWSAITKYLVENSDISWFQDVGGTEALKKARDVLSEGRPLEELSTKERQIAETMQELQSRATDAGGMDKIEPPIDMDFHEENQSIEKNFYWRRKTSAFKGRAQPKEESERTGLGFKKFFSDVTTGTFGKSNVEFEPVLDLNNPIDSATVAEMNKHSGNFDEHIAKSIPTFEEVQIKKAGAIKAAYPEGADVLDIGASEGSLGKTISALSKGTIRTVSLDPNPDMAAFFENHSQVPGAEYSDSAFLRGLEDAGRPVPAYDPGDRRFDVVNESMAFQFISPERTEQISEAKRFLKPDGILIIEEKVKNQGWAANEKLKDSEFKNRYFSEADLKAKEQKVGFSQSKDESKAVGMVDNMTSDAQLEDLLRSQFEHVSQYWDSGNFKGYVASDSKPALDRFIFQVGDVNSKFSTLETPRKVEGMTASEMRARLSSGFGQFQPKAGDAPEFKLRKPAAGGMFSKAWIVPTGEPVQLGGKWHHEWLNENPDVMERFGIEPPEDDGDARISTLRRGFARLNYARNGGQLTVEARAADWAKLKPSVQQFVESNIDQIDNLRIELFNDDVSALADSGSARFMNMDSDVEKLAAIPFLDTAPAAGAAGGRISGIAQARARQFQPQQEEFAGMPTGSKPFLSTSQLATMSRKELMDHFPEAIVPKRSADSIPSKLREAPLIKDADDPVQTYADKLTEFARTVETTPEYQMGRKWYSEFSEQLKARFGADARVFAELLAATSPQTSVESNFKFALDALEGFKSGRFKQNIKKFEQGLSLIANEKWLSWYNRELNAGRIKNPPAKPTPAAFMARWIEAHDIKPRQSNGKLFGINSIPVLQVAARRWLEQNKGPKVKNFVENLLGEGTEATIDLWADRTLRRLGYSDFQERWRIMPVNKQGVSDEDFAFAQSIFRNAAQQLGMKPSELQAAVWFAEKQLWADNGWSRLDLGDFREQLKKTDALRAEIRGREQSAESTPDLLSVEPRAIVR